MIKIISGGQTGADRAALEVAKEFGIETGGTAPRNWRTECGSDPTLADFGLVEHYMSSYPPRTAANVADADVTVWFGKLASSGFECTRKATVRHGKPFLINPSSELLTNLVNRHDYHVINVAGNRLSTNPGIDTAVRAILAEVFKELKYDREAASL